jgi:S-formylglutathione hydrolase FrmB/Tol biopolymer transport system component
MTMRMRVAGAAGLAAVGFFVRGADVKTFDVPSAAMDKTVKVSVVTPAGYSDQGWTLYPAVYLLHGAGNTHETYLQPFLFEAVDRYGFVAVVPDGELDWWMDSPVHPKIRRETFVVKELVPWVDAHFRTWPVRERRAIAGHSMGGQGAMRLGMRHTELFSIVGNVMGGVDICACNRRQDVARILGPYAQNQARWRAFSVLTEAEKLEPGRLHLFTIVGTGDFFLKPNRALHERLTARGLAHEYTEVRGPTEALSRHTRPFAYWGLERLFERIAVCLKEEVKGPLPLVTYVTAGAEEAVCAGEEPAVSPDGKRVAFQRRGEKGYAVFVRTLDSGREERISPEPGQACYPEWGADGSVLYTYADERKTGFAGRDETTGWNLWLWRDGVRRQVTQGRRRAYTASFSPDGKTVYFASDRVAVSEADRNNGNAISRVGLAAVDVDGQNERTVWALPQINTACCEPRVSPDGTALLRAELAKFRQTWRLVISPLQAPAECRFLTSLYEAAYAPAWRPDGRLIAYTGFREGASGWGVYVMPPTAQGTQRIAEGTNPAFAPDGRVLFYERDGMIYKREVAR